MGRRVNISGGRPSKTTIAMCLPPHSPTYRNVGNFDGTPEFLFQHLNVDFALCFDGLWSPYW